MTNNNKIIIDKKHYHNLTSFLKLPPFFILNSLLMHIIVLSFLLTLPLYSTGNGNKSLRAYFTYLAGEEEYKEKLLSDNNNSPKQGPVSRNNEEEKKLPDNVIHENKNEEKSVLQEKSVEDVLPEDISSERNIGEPPVEIKEKQTDAVEKALDTKASSAPEFAKQDKTIGKEMEKAERPHTTEQTVPVEHITQDKKPVVPHIEPQVISSGIEQPRKENEKPLAEVNEQKDISLPPADLQTSSQNNISESAMKLPAGDSQLTGQQSVVMIEKDITIDKEERKTEKPEISREPQKIKPEKKSLPVITHKNNIEKPVTKKSSVAGKLSTPSNIKQVMPARKEEKSPGMSIVVDDTNPAKNNLHMEKPAQETKEEKVVAKPLSEKNSADPLFSTLEEKMKHYFLDLRPMNEKISVSDSETKLFGLSGQTDVILESALMAGNVETESSHRKRPEKDVNAVSEIKEQFQENTEAEVEKPSIGLPLDETLFYKDIRIEILQKDIESPGADIYLLKNNYRSLRKKHTWGMEKKAEITSETVKNHNTEKGVKKVYSVAKSDSGIYTFVIENKNTVPYNAAVIFVLYGEQKRERRKEIKAVNIPPSSKVRFMFVLPDTVFWDDEDFFTGNLEDSDSITKFNDKTGFVWREEKDHESR